MTKPKPSNTIVKFKNIVTSLLILIFVLFISISPSFASITPAPADNPPYKSNIVDNSNLADAVPSASASTESEFQRCPAGCTWDSAEGVCKSRRTGEQC